MHSMYFLFIFIACANFLIYFLFFIANFLAWASLAAANSVRNMSRTAVTPNSTAEMTISNELIGCIIGKGGTKINEIR